MKEEFLHYVWNTKNFQHKNLTTTQGEFLQILNHGTHNQDAGPDFNQGKISIQERIWIGHIEIHLKASDWYRHKHHLDSKYQNVILHVVWESDVDIELQDGSILPCLELKDRVSNHLWDNYRLLLQQNTWIPCAYHLQSTALDAFYFQRFNIYIDKLEKKFERIQEMYLSFDKNWEQVFFVLLARAFGGKVNADAMESLARKTPLKYLQKSAFDPFQLEAILFGQAGLLHHKLEDEYPLKLGKEYSFLSKKYKLQPLTGMEWKLLRMRPCSFPAIRISQLAQLIGKQPQLHHQIANTSSIEAMCKLLTTKTNVYWESHYIFDKKSNHIEPKELSIQMKNSIITNAIIPYLFARGKMKKEEAWIERALLLIEELPAEQNQIIRNWKKLGIEVQSRLDSQALIHLFQQYCKPKKCLSCQYGNQLIKTMTSTIFEPTDPIYS